MTYAYRNPDHTIIARTDEDGHVTILEPGHPDWLAALAEDVADYVAPVEPMDPKLAGVEFDGVMCSATGNDQNGLVAVLTAIQLQGAGFQPTRFEFDNGSTLVITLENYAAFMAVWMPFRQSFFAA